MPPEPPLRLLVCAVSLGGALGGLLRWVLLETFPDPAGTPWTTWWINVSGAAALAALPLLLAAGPWGVHGRQLLAAFLGPGFLGGYTTLSAYALLSRDLLAAGALGTTAVMLLGTLAVSLAAVAVVRRWERRPGRAAHLR